MEDKSHWNKNVDWAVQKDFIQICQHELLSSLLFKVTQKVPSFLSMSIFTSVGNNFVLTQENV